MARATAQPTPLQSRPRSSAGFTLLELMIVLVIIAVIAGIVGFNLVGQADRAKRDASIVAMKTVQQALDLYRVRYNTYPPTNPGLAALMSEKLLNAEPRDRWGFMFEYYAPTSASPDGYELVSVGSDGKFGGPDDIRALPGQEPQ